MNETVISVFSMLVCLHEIFWFILVKTFTLQTINFS